MRGMLRLTAMVCAAGFAGYAGVRAHAAPTRPQDSSCFNLTEEIPQPDGTTVSRRSRVCRGADGKYHTQAELPPAPPQPAAPPPVQPVQPVQPVYYGAVRVEIGNAEIRGLVLDVLGKEEGIASAIRMAQGKCHITAAEYQEWMRLRRIYDSYSRIDDANLHDWNMAARALSQYEGALGTRARDNALAGRHVC